MPNTQPKPGEIIDVTPFGSALDEAKTSTIFQTDRIKLVRIVMQTGKVIPEHEAPGEITVHCLEGRIEFTGAGKKQELGPGQLLYLKAEAPHAVRCLEAASFLVTMLTGR